MTETPYSGKLYRAGNGPTRTAHPDVRHEREIGCARRKETSATANPQATANLLVPRCLPAKRPHPNRALGKKRVKSEPAWSLE
jgi:hypothetical protein